MNLKKLIIVPRQSIHPFVTFNTPHQRIDDVLGKSGRTPAVINDAGVQIEPSYDIKHYNINEPEKASYIVQYGAINVYYDINDKIKSFAIDVQRMNERPISIKVSENDVVDIRGKVASEIIKELSLYEAPDATSDTRGGFFRDFNIEIISKSLWMYPSIINVYR